MKENCWEFKKCGRQPGGEHVQELGECPAALERRLNGIHGGKNGGRACWVVAGIFSNKESYGGACASYPKNCVACDFYRTVRKDEFPKFQLSSTILQRLEEDKCALR